LSIIPLNFKFFSSINHQLPSMGSGVSSSSDALRSPTDFLSPPIRMSRYRRSKESSNNPPPTTEEQFPEQISTTPDDHDSNYFTISDNATSTLPPSPDHVSSSITRLSLEVLLDRRQRGPIHRVPLIDRFPPRSRPRHQSIKGVLKTWGLHGEGRDEGIEHTPREEEGEVSGVGRGEGTKKARGGAI